MGGDYFRAPHLRHIHSVRVVDRPYLLLGSVTLLVYPPLLPFQNFFPRIRLILGDFNRLGYSLCIPFHLS